jgi:hypothetical protein
MALKLLKLKYGCESYSHSKQYIPHFWAVFEKPEKVAKINQKAKVLGCTFWLILDANSFPGSLL